MIKAHVFTNTPESQFLKQMPGFKRSLRGISFTFGIEPPPEDTDVLIVYNRASYSIPTYLPVERTVFIAAEPDVIHPYATGFLNQFGTVMTYSDVPLKARKIRAPTAAMWSWYAGVDFSKPFSTEYDVGYDHFKALKCPEKSDKISIVTSDKVLTRYHEKRLAFIEVLKQRIPDHLDIYGRGFKSVDDKQSALLPHKYHLAIENGDAPFGWTEKLADPLLTFAFPFHAGCPNIEDDLPSGCFEMIDIDKPEQEADRMVQEVQNGRWRAALPAIEKARHIILDRYNLSFRLVDLVLLAMETPVDQDRLPKTRLIRSERSLWPEKGTRGSLGQWVIRAPILRLYPNAELKVAILQQKIEQRRIEVRRARQSKKEARLRD